jgi:hypothetical protein
MKRFKISIVVLLCSIVALTSCEEENISPKQTDKIATQKHKPMNHKDGGGDEEDWIIIRGVVQNESTSGVISGAEVILFDEDNNVAFDTVLTNSLGEFEFQNDSSFYTFKVSMDEYQTLITNPIEFPESNPVTLDLVEE